MALLLHRALAHCIHRSVSAHLFARAAGEHLHMAKAAEGRNQAEDNPIDHALHDALKLER